MVVTSPNLKHTCVPSVLCANLTKTSKFHLKKKGRKNPYGIRNSLLLFYFSIVVPNKIPKPT
jgi:hypothetical protein